MIVDVMRNRDKLLSLMPYLRETTITITDNARYEKLVMGIYPGNDYM